MSFTSQKITTGDISSQGVQSKPDKLTGTAAQNKQAFDNLVSATVKERFNALIDELLDAGAAAQIGVDAITGLTADNVQAALEAIVENQQEMSQAVVADGSISTAKLADAAVTTAKIAALAVTGALIAAGAVSTEKLDDAAVTTAKITAAAVTTALLADGAVTADKLASTCVTAAKIAAGAVETTKLATGAVTTVKIADEAVTAAKIKDGDITYAKMNANAKSVAESKTVASTDWSNGSVTVTGWTNVTADNNILVTPAPSSMSDWAECEIKCTAQGSGSITLTCESAPTGSITVQVLGVR